MQIKGFVQAYPNIVAFVDLTGAPNGFYVFEMSLKDQPWSVPGLLEIYPNGQKPNISIRCLDFLNQSLSATSSMLFL